MIITVSPSSSLVRPLLVSLAALALGLWTSSKGGFERPGPVGAWEPVLPAVSATSGLLALPWAAGADVGLTLVVEGGRLAGFSLKSVRAGSPWARAGLRDGDVIRNVDGAAVTDLAQVLHVLSSSPRHLLVVVRPGDADPSLLKLDLAFHP